MKKEFNSELVCNKDILKDKVKSHDCEVTDFYDKEIPKVGFNHTCSGKSPGFCSQKR